MAVSVLENIRIKCINLYNDADRSIYIDNATLLTSIDYFGNKYNLAVSLRACHDYTLVNRPGSSSGGGGAITSLREGQIQINYGASQDGNDAEQDLKQTVYGRQLLALIKSCNPAASIATQNISVLGGFPTS